MSNILLDKCDKLGCNKSFVDTPWILDNLRFCSIECKFEHWIKHLNVKIVD